MPPTVSALQAVLDFLMGQDYASLALQEQCAKQVIVKKNIYIGRSTLKISQNYNTTKRIGRATVTCKKFETYIIFSQDLVQGRSFVHYDSLTAFPLEGSLLPVRV